MGGGPGAWEGVAYLGGQPVCRDGWGRAEAGVFCKMMGFRDGFEEEETDVVVKGPFAMNHVRCKGTEDSLADCKPKRLGRFAETGSVPARQPQICTIL